MTSVVIHSCTKVLKMNRVSHNWLSYATTFTLSISSFIEKHNLMVHKAQTIQPWIPSFFWGSIPCLCTVDHCTIYEEHQCMISCSIAQSISSCTHPILPHLFPSLWCLAIWMCCLEALLAICISSLRCASLKYFLKIQLLLVVEF